jgi:hypothetical protein
MKKILILLLLLLVVGCTAGPAETIDDVEVKEMIEDEELVVEEMMEDEYSIEEESMEKEMMEDPVHSYDLSAAEEELLISRFDPSERADVSRPLVKELHVGDVHVLGLAVRNILGQSSRDFVIEVDLVDVRDYTNGVHNTDDALMEAWFERTDMGPYTMERGDEVIVPLVVEIGDMITEMDEVIPGNYNFDITVAYLTSGGATDDYETVRITLQVVE